MVDPFILRALLAGSIVALTAAPLGCFVVWKRMAYFGDALAHAALLGVALALAVAMPVQLGIVLVCILFAGAMYALQRHKGLSKDTLLGILAHATLAYGLVGIALMPGVRVDLHGILFGDILSVSMTDIYVIVAGALAVGGMLTRVWQPMLLATLSEDLARAEGLNTSRLQGVLLICLTVTVALAVHIVGVLLVTSMLIIPAATARLFATSPERMAVLAALTGGVAVAGGVYTSVMLDVPTGPSIVALLATLFFVATAVRRT